MVKCRNTVFLLVKDFKCTRVNKILSTLFFGTLLCVLIYKNEDTGLKYFWEVAIQAALE